MLKNQLKTFFLLGFMGAILFTSAQLIGGAQSAIPAITMAVSLTVFSYFFSSSMVLAMHRAQPLTPENAPDIFATIEELTIAMNLPMPKIYHIPSKIANAFATGRNPKNAVVGVTDGIRNLLSHQELRGVLAHELAHIQNRDTLLMTVATTMAAAIGYLANIARNLSPRTRRHQNQKMNSTPGPLARLIIVFVMPIAATLVRLSVSRNREFIADEIGAIACQDPLALASALEKLHENKKFAHLKPYDIMRASSEPIFIVNPLWGKGSFSTLFSTHPPVGERVKRLQNLYERMFRN